MSRIIGVLNYKGGTAKTTTVVNVAAGLAMRGARVLCIDLDAQGGLALSLGTRYRYTLTDLLLGRVEPEDCVVCARRNLDIIASDRSLLSAEGELWRMGDERAARRRLADGMRDLRGYDYILLDFSPSVNIVSENGLLFTEEMIVPVATDYMALAGTRQVIDTLKSVYWEMQHYIKLYLVLPSFYYEQRRKDREVIELLQRYFGSRVAEPIRANVRLAEAPGFGQTIYEYDPRCSGAEDYGRLVERIARDG